MEILTTSLEALLERATNPQNENVDKAAVEAFSALVNKESEGSHIAIRLLANKIHAQNEREALQALGVLDYCMNKCGSSFQNEVGKFRFLNEMIKLVSPKYLGSQTPPLVRVKVLEILKIWVDDFPKEQKIREAYDMLKKQGVLIEIPLQKTTEAASVQRTSKTNSIFDNDERSRLLQKLLQSKNPDDLQTANRLIKTMVKEDDKRAELVSKRVIELEAVHNNIRLLNEMLDSYRPGQSSTDESDLIKELHQSCERLRPNVFRLASETQGNEELLKEVLHASDELGQVFDKYTAIILKGVVLPPVKSAVIGESLLDLGSPSYNQTPLFLDNSSMMNNNGKILSKNDEPQSDIEALCDIFSSPTLAVPSTIPETPILKPTSLQQPVTCALNNTASKESEKVSKSKGLEDLDVLGESLLKQNLSASCSKLGSAFNRMSEKIPMNLLTKTPVPEPPPAIPSQLPKTERSPAPTQDLASGGLDFFMFPLAVNKITDDDCMVDISEEINLCEITVADRKESDSELVIKKPIEVEPLTDIEVSLESITPSSIEPQTVTSGTEPVSVVFHYAKDKPREDAQVIVVTTISKHKLPIKNYVFQAMVPNSCKVKLQPPSATSLPAHTPFQPPAAITQIMILAKPTNETITMKFKLSYTTKTERCMQTGTVTDVPWVS